MVAPLLQGIPRYEGRDRLHVPSPRACYPTRRDPERNLGASHAPDFDLRAPTLLAPLVRFLLPWLRTAVEDHEVPWVGTAPIHVACGLRQALFERLIHAAAQPHADRVREALHSRLELGYTGRRTAQGGDRAPPRGSGKRRRHRAP